MDPKMRYPNFGKVPNSHPQPEPNLGREPAVGDAQQALGVREKEETAAILALPQAGLGASG